MHLFRICLALLLGLGVLWADISPRRYVENVRALSDDKLKGRGNDLPELREAARYIADKFRGCGLEPLNGTWFQSFRAVTGASAGDNNQLSLKISGSTNTYQSGSDFVPIGFAESGTVAGQVVFAGYGITAREYSYDDYAHLDVKGKIVLVLRHEPQEQDEKSVFMGRQYTSHAGIVEKAVNARMHGAAGLLLVNDPIAHEGDDDPLMRIETSAGPDRIGIPALHVRRSMAEVMLQPAGKSLKDVQAAIDRDLSSESLSLSVEVQMTVDVARRARELENVVGLLAGSDPALSKETIVIGAHYDHLGLGDRDSMDPSPIGKIHHGADDNASGSAGLIELACDLVPRRKQLKRSVLFLAFSGEELGLLGSRHYTINPLRPIESTIAMINLDMIGRPKDRKIYVGGVGTAKEFRSLVEEANKVVEMKLEFSNTGYDASDHTSFALSQVPVLFFFSGLHSDYHRPTDTWEKINAKEAVDLLRLVENVALRLDSTAERPQYVRVAEPARRAGGVGGGGSGYGAWFGSIPDFGEVERGVKFADIRDGSPAAKAGLRAGDILIEFAGKPVLNLNDFTYMLRSHKPGDEVAVAVLRGQEKITAKVVLAKRP